MINSLQFTINKPNTPPNSFTGGSNEHFKVTKANSFQLFYREPQQNTKNTHKQNKRGTKMVVEKITLHGKAVRIWIPKHVEEKIKEWFPEYERP